MTRSFSPMPCGAIASMPIRPSWAARFLSTAIHSRWPASPRRTSQESSAASPRQHGFRSPVSAVFPRIPHLIPLLHYGLQVAVRLRPGVTDASAAAELHALAHAFALQQHGDNGGRWDWNLRDAAHFQRGLFNMVGSQLPVLLGASACSWCWSASTSLRSWANMRRAVAAKSLSAPHWAQRQTHRGAGTCRDWLTCSCRWAGRMGGQHRHGACALRTSTRLRRATGLQPAQRHAHSAFVTAVAVVVTLACGIYPVRQSLRVSQNEALHEGGAAVAGGSRKKFGRRMLLGLQLGICLSSWSAAACSRGRRSIS